MIPNREGWHYITVQQFPDLLREITTKNHGDFYFLNCLLSLEQKANLNKKKHLKIKFPQYCNDF